ncbi:MAG TPA: hypothetical protein VFJ29_07810 [Candidatus Kapabacteria bacterium]|nr:hypothetical protein [Candidatus Kapabacteria bacterium]
MNSLLKILRFTAPGFLAMILWSCTNQGPTNTPSNFYSADPVARAYGNAVVFSTNGLYDVGVSLQRSDVKGASFGAMAAMAFDKGWIPVGASEATVNGIQLPWLAGGSNDFLPNTFGLIDSALFGSTDTMTFGYSNFDNDYFGGTADVAPPFNVKAYPDTVSASQGFTLTFSRSVPGDSVQVTIAAYDSVSIDSSVVIGVFVVPDSGSIVFTPQILPFSKGGTYLYNLAILRQHFATRTSGNGKKIGIYSTYLSQASMRVKP